MLALGVSAQATTFKWAGTTDPQTMDPHAVNSAPVLGFLNNIYEGLVRRGPDMSIEPSLATAWEPIGNGEGWRFHLRQDVSFHNGAEFNADDVVFSYQRASSEPADVKGWFAPIESVKKVDDYTVDFYTSAPNPIFPDSIANWMIMDSDWAKEVGAELPNKDAGNAATLQTNGTGAYMLKNRQPGLETTLVRFNSWWGGETGNITEATFTPIQNPATAVAALLSGDVDMINPVPIQDAARLEGNANVRVIKGIEARVIMLGFAQGADTLKYGANKGEPNPFLEPKVRQAVAHAINVPAILRTIMRGNAEPASQLVSPAMRGYSTEHSARPEFDVAKAKALLAEAGYADGFSFGLKCPNDRYLNDEAVCQAVTSMLAKVGINAELDAMPVRNYWPELREDNFDMYLLGWSPGTFDHEHPIRFLASTPNAEKKLGSWNFGDYSNSRIDELLPMIQSEIDDSKRQAMIDEVTELYQSEQAYVPLYIQPLVWGTGADVSLVQRPDNFFILRWASVN
ncbi:ABC transporter substrate-binding protein [Reinekea thalattae]|uniref:ABC transporter substrate-binding protein n=2 Tax=Reinekea thalattae TaxID=2593301 RepID=A0A5C8ZAL2_9GAMM|nr:ABC transporter substrate-binding protein [Reinekea thalattae]